MTNTWIDKYLANQGTSRKSRGALDLLTLTHELANANGAARYKDLPKGYDDRIDLFLGTLNLAADSITASAKLLVVLVDQNENAFEDIIKRAPHISAGLLEGLYRCGKNGINPILLLKNGAAMRHVLRLNSDASRIANEVGLPVLVAGRGDDKAVEYRPLENITATQAALAITEEGTIRTPGQLREAYNERMRRSTVTAPRYDIADDGTVEFVAHTKMPPSMVQKIATEALEKAMEYLRKQSTKAIS